MYKHCRMWLEKKGITMQGIDKIIEKIISDAEADAKQTAAHD